MICSPEQICCVGEDTTMKIHELQAILATMDPDNDVFAAFFKADGTDEVFDIEAVQDNSGHAQLDIYEEGEAPGGEDGNGAVRRKDEEGTSDAAEAAAEAFLDLCERRGITEEEKDLIWNAMAFICYEQVKERQGPFYEAIKPLLTGEEE
jgi:hypothetical protein